MKLIFLLQLLFIFNQSAVYADFNIRPEGYFIENVYPKNEWVGIILKDKTAGKVLKFKVNVKTFETVILDDNSMNVEFLSSATTASKDQISYTLDNCLSIDEEYHSYDSLCKSATFSVNGKKHVFNKDKFYKWEVYIDPVLWKNFLIFKQYSGGVISGDTGKKHGPKINGLQILDLNQKKVIDLFNFRGNFITSLKVDNFNSFIWIGSEYGLYALDENLNEKISCAFFKKINEVELICSAPDYIHDNKRYQSKFLIEKYLALKSGKKPPTDSSKKLDETVNKLFKKKP